MRWIELLTGSNLETREKSYLVEVYEQPVLYRAKGQAFHKFVEPFIDKHGDLLDPIYMWNHRRKTGCQNDCTTVTTVATGEKRKICGRGPMKYDVDFMCYRQQMKKAKLMYSFDVDRGTYLELGGKYAD